MSEAAEHASGWSGSNATCVLLCAPAAKASGAEAEVAIGWLESQGWRTVRVSDPLDAMSGLCLLERAHASHTAWGLERVDEIALMIASPDETDEISLLRAAIARHIPSARVWTWPEVGAHTPDLDATASRHAQNRPIGAPQVVRTNGTRAPDAASDEAAPCGDGHEITRREIAMLLDLDGEEESA